MLDTISFNGLLIGVATFLIIGLFHPLVVKAEYYIGTKSWWLFLLFGIISTAISIFITNVFASIIFGIIAFSFFWSILEVFQQAKRVRKGWFHANPNKQNKN
ncbi:MAG: DUF4491 family protein [Ignavibacteria bacterium]|jgi:hypothetical protein|nr:DUF4491 family protein [Ignavibacteria bacterium]